jgi:hypothetical protein
LGPVERQEGDADWRRHSAGGRVEEIALRDAAEKTEMLQVRAHLEKQ